MIRGWYSDHFVSPLDGTPIVVVLTRGTINPKTGDVVQSWLMPRDIPPMEAIRSGRDLSVCGHCVQRPSLGGRCYVRPAQGAIPIWKAYRRGSYRHIENWHGGMIRKWAKGCPLRLGSWGDPAIVPVDWWQEIIQWIGSSRRWTGFSHQWLLPFAQGHKSLCMASVESTEEAAEAQALGWRTFRTTLRPDEGPARGEFVCPASAAKGKRLTCRQCAACHGNPHDRDAHLAGNVLIVEHGPRSKGKLVQMETLGGV